ncbi:MAG: nucleotidyltransferase, partial [Bacteroidota bacterium]|nr:nucleotidyltransferase [Bacteroidota bacterium]
KKNFIIQLGHEPVRIDISNDVEGVPFSKAWENRKNIEYGGMTINFVGYEELLILKKTAGRSQDLTDIKMLMARNKKK